ncbi:hypothetical protein [Francisella philomiragia]|uniref:hypothetical protein n=1 Tax=Francisella philomiragia TaxID=28110 RepID=UPI002243DB52|nr:hypothetical protein [Francisella philomiragia]
MDNELNIGIQNAKDINNNAAKIKIKEQNNYQYNHETHPYAEYSFENVGGVCHLDSYLKYWIILPTLFFSTFLITVYMNIASIAVISFILFLLSFLLYSIRSNEYDSLVQKNYCYTWSSKLYFLDYDSNYIIRYKINGVCPMHGCNHMLYFTKVEQNQEGHRCVVACGNTPHHFFRFNRPKKHTGEIATGELITLTYVPKNKL